MQAASARRRAVHISGSMLCGRAVIIHHHWDGYIRCTRIHEPNKTPAQTPTMRSHQRITILLFNYDLNATFSIDQLCVLSHEWRCDRMNCVLALLTSPLNFTAVVPNFGSRVKLECQR
ncbi:hypothetical protein Zmor_005671 [Zophobas morio]|uniref:Uncharacterized protein n=1 Tax=Zophobas morio TaxID=2755281 RepID=A0AA38MMR3_9CUCU|nr:hypothetical protein Zmor_005671 [Zophobas morio]